MKPRERRGEEFEERVRMCAEEAGVEVDEGLRRFAVAVLELYAGELEAEVLRALGVVGQ